MLNNMDIFAAPSRYIQGADAIYSLYEFIKPLGNHILTVGGQTGLKVTRDGRCSSFLHSSISQFEEQLPGKASLAEISYLTDKAEKLHCDVIMACGGGKIIDSAKAAAQNLGIRTVIIPTTASSDAPCSALSVIYNDDGSFSHLMPLNKNPDIVLVDTAIIAYAPSSLLVAGMGDALATYFEAEACVLSGARNTLGGNPSLAAVAIARLCRDTILEFGRAAKHDCDNNTVTDALSKVVEASVLLSGIGFESGGVAAAHAIAEAFSAIPALHRYRHGELVAFGLLTHLLLADCPDDSLNDIYSFCHDVGLPITLDQLGINNLDSALLHRIADDAASPDRPSHNLRAGITGAEIFDALIQTDKRGIVCLKG